MILIMSQKKTWTPNYKVIELCLKEKNLTVIFNRFKCTWLESSAKYNRNRKSETS